MKNKKKLLIGISLTIVFVILLCFSVFGAYYHQLDYKEAELNTISEEDENLYNKEQQDSELVDSNEEDIKNMEQKILDNIKNNSTDIPFNENVFNILLIGTDNRENVSGSRSDSMILCSLNKETKQVTLTSFMRDCYVSIPNHGNNRLNAAYSFGGTQLLIDTIEQNFKINIDRYAQVDFFSFIDIIDDIGGVDIELSDDEIQILNLYVNDINRLTGTDKTANSISGTSGTYHLNGAQALSYARNRKTGNSDFSRTERQRKVLMAIKNTISDLNIIELNSLCQKILPNITTDLTEGECLSLILNASSYLSNDIISNRVPYDGTYGSLTVRKMMVLDVDFEKNIEYLRRDIYGKK